MRRALIVLGLTLVLVLGLVVWRADELGVGDLVDEFTGSTEPDPVVDGPAAVPPPAGLDLPRLPDAAPVAAERADRAVEPRAVRQALGRLTRDKRLGRRVAVAVAGLDGRTAYDEGPRVVIPASLLKTATTLAALELVGPEERFTTSVVRRAGALTLVGGGDPLLTGAADPDAVPREADLTTLARRTAQALRRDGGPKRVTLRYDDSLFSGPAVSPDWENDYIPDNVVSPITALWVDEGREYPGAFTRSDDPSRAAAQRFADALGAAGVKVAGPPRPGNAPGRDPIASVDSARLVEIVEHVLETSDNEAAEVLLRHVGLAASNDSGGAGGSFAAGARAVTSTLSDLGVRLRGARIVDGSGLSRDNLLGVDALLDILTTSLDPKRPLLSGMVGGLPVAGFSGSLTSRFDVDSDAGLGWVRAKTGTLTGVHGLSGTVTGRDGTPMLFVAVMDRVKVRNTLEARARLDQIASALAGCRCGPP